MTERLDLVKYSEKIENQNIWNKRTTCENKFFNKWKGKRVTVGEGLGVDVISKILKNFIVNIQKLRLNFLPIQNPGVFQIRKLIY